MALDVYIQNDLERGLRSTLIMALATYAANGGHNTEHAAGVLDCAHAQACLYGIDWLALIASSRRDLGVDARDLLDAALKSAAIEG